MRPKFAALIGFVMGVLGTVLMYENRPVPTAGLGAGPSYGAPLGTTGAVNRSSEYQPVAPNNVGDPS